MTKLIDQQYELVDVDELSWHPDNPRRGDIDAIASSIDAHGFYGAIIVQRSTMHVLAGNHRLLAAQQQGIDRLPVIFIDVEDDEARRIVLIDNRLNDLAEYDTDQLVAVLRELGDELDGTGYTSDDFDELVRRLDAGVLDPLAEWEGMPEYSNERVGFQTVRVHFRNAEDRDSFAKLIDQPLTDKTSFVWHPADPKQHVADIAYVHGEH